MTIFGMSPAEYAQEVDLAALWVAPTFLMFLNPLWEGLFLAFPFTVW